jgi:hypothetical protein
MLTEPYHRRTRPAPQKYSWFKLDRIDLTSAHLPAYPTPDPSGVLPDSRPLANSLFDSRAAAAVQTLASGPITIAPDLDPNPDDALLEVVFYGGGLGIGNVYIPKARCLALMAYTDYFQDSPIGPTFRGAVSQAILAASPGWCGTYGPDVGDQGQANTEGNYDFAQMFMLALVYNFYDELPEARERLITLLLAQGRVHRANVDDTITSGVAPNDWSRAGYAKVLFNVYDIPETENHVLMIATARYLTNQLLYPRNNYNPGYDNRRNGHPGDSTPSCMGQVLGLLRNYLRDDFAEYNAKNYQEETRHALLNLCSYAYDAEVRLGARMVLDYISAHIAVSSSDLRRMVPFRRRNEPVNVNQIPGTNFMDVALLDAHGADPMPAQFALLAGNTRAYEKPNNRVWPGERTAARPWSWAITANRGRPGDFSGELILGALSSYRLPPSIHDLFVNDLHRRFFQRIHRHTLEEPGQQRNCDNMEIYSGSPSYLITAGGEPADYVIHGAYGQGWKDQNLGVAVPTSFMPTGRSAGRNVSLQQLANGAGVRVHPVSLKAVAGVFGRSAPFSLSELFLNTNNASDLIQLSKFSSVFVQQLGGVPFLGTVNYGVAPDFACGYGVHLPIWTGVPENQDGLFFVNKKSHDGSEEPAGFFLAIYKSQNLVLMEAFDTWLHPEVSFEQFKQHVTADNPNIQIKDEQEAMYVTFFGNKVHFVIWASGAKIVNIEYGAGNPADTLAEAGNYTDQSQFLSGTVLKSAGDAVTEIHNAFLGTKITLDWSNPSHLVRIAEDGEVEQAGTNPTGQLFEVWVDFDWKGPTEGDFYHPFNQLASALAAVADGGVIKIAPGTTHERVPLRRAGKRVKLVAPIGGVTIGAR